MCVRACPQFSNLGPLDAQHGFARNLAWAWEASGGAADVTLLLRPGPAELEQWPHPFELRMRLALGRDSLTQVGQAAPLLSLTLRCMNARVAHGALRDRCLCVLASLPIRAPSPSSHGLTRPFISRMKQEEMSHQNTGPDVLP